MNYLKDKLSIKYKRSIDKNWAHKNYRESKVNDLSYVMELVAYIICSGYAQMKRLITERYIKNYWEIKSLKIIKKLMR